MLTKQEKIEQFCDKHDWLLGDSFLKRAFAIYGYVMIAGVTVYGVILVVFMMLASIGLDVS
ncbi:hypothetical protein HN588_13860 [Candidatus Bathyarchaeota archaeon]|nr:hypothetical protein [Candidatus Bathyarchaeota archaeon]